MSYLFHDDTFSVDDDYDAETEALLRYAEELERENREIEESLQRRKRQEELEQKQQESKYTSNGGFELGFDFKNKKFISKRPKRKKITGIKFGFIPNNGAYIEIETETVE